jgi:NAD(P)-dependent dehydrogenase (short-subunit alcohol dehydrogenase family)
MSETRVAIITAAGRGIGAACARDLAAKGYRIALISQSVDAINLARDLNGTGIQGSVTIGADLKNLVTRTIETGCPLNAETISMGFVP